MKRFFRIFELSKNEQRVVLIVIFALLADYALSDTNAAFIISRSAVISNGTQTISDCCGNGRRSVVLLRWQARNSAVADKDRTNFGVSAFRRRRHFEIENADAPTLFAIVRAAVA